MAGPNLHAAPLHMEECRKVCGQQDNDSLHSKLLLVLSGKVVSSIIHVDNAQSIANSLCAKTL